MNRLLLVLLLPLILNASKILSYNVYDRSDRVDVMITFDTPYTGKIKQSTSPSKIIIKLEDASIESSKTKRLSSKYLDSLNIIPNSDHTQVIAHVPPSVKFKASKTSDAYGLRLRFTSANESVKNKTAGTLLSNNAAPNKTTSSLPTKQSDDISQSYYIVIAILLIGIIILFVLKNKIGSQNKESKTDSWLFKVAQDANNDKLAGVSIRFQKNINEQNSVVMLDFMEQSYLVLMGPNNILLDKYTDNKLATQEDFEAMLQNRHQELDDFLKGKADSKSGLDKDPMQIYKEKAASISYSE